MTIPEPVPATPTISSKLDTVEWAKARWIFALQNATPWEIGACIEDGALSILSNSSPFLR
jgi:hypothetical protein